MKINEPDCLEACFPQQDLVSGYHQHEVQVGHLLTRQHAQELIVLASK